jgi:anti-sigma factor RsiW
VSGLDGKTMHCSHFEALLSDGIEGSLVPPEARAMEQHRQDCARCALLWRQVHMLVQELHAFPEVQPPQDLVDAILSRTSLGRSRRVAMPVTGAGAFLLATLRPFLTQRNAAAVAIACLFALVGSGLTAPGPAKWSLAGLNPAAVYLRADVGSYRTYRRVLKWNQAVSVAGVKASTRMAEWLSFLEMHWKEPQSRGSV